MIRARLRVPARGLKASEAIVNCVKPDNVGMKGLVVKGRASAKDVSFTISFDGRIETFISTLDDLLRCIQAASATLSTITRDKGN